MLAAGVISLAACDRAAPPQAAPAPVANATAAAGAPVASASWPAFVDVFVEAYFKANPAFAVLQGRHEYDGVFPDWSRAGIQQEVARLHVMRDRAQAFAAASLDAAQKFERDYLLARIDNDLFAIEVAQRPFKNPAFYIGDALDPSVYVSRPYADADTRARAFIKYARGVVAAAPLIRANLPEVMPATFVKLGVAGFGGLAQFYRKDVPLAFVDVKDAAVKAELIGALPAAANAMQGLADSIEASRAKATAPEPLGAENYAKMLRMTERVDVPVAAIEAAGRADLARNLTALREECAKLAPKASLVACTQTVMADKPVGGAVAGARKQLAQLRQFIVDKDLVSIPGTEQAEVVEAPPFNRQNFAFIQIAGPYDKGLPSQYNIAPPDPSWSKAEQAAYVPGRDSLLFTSAHEVWPGHFLQFLHSNRVQSKIGQLFVGYAFAEGWAHYSEEMMWEAGLGQGDPAVHIGQINQALLRDVRLLCSIGMHTEGMTLEQCDAMFREQALQNAGQARQQAARGTYDPGYLYYTLGKLMIRKLRTDWTASRGGRAAWKQFHDEFLSYGGPPIPLVRAAMMGPGAGPAL